jgi:dienelactone hydrolase
VLSALARAYDLLLPPGLARAGDVLLVRWMAGHGHLRPVPGRIPRPGPVPDSPDAIAWPAAPILPEYKPLSEDGILQFQAPSPVPAPDPANQVIHGRALGPPDARCAIVLLHGSYGEYKPCEIMAGSFTKHGFRALIPAAPFHLERTPPGLEHGTAFFWTTDLVVSGLAQWLAEVRGLIAGLRQQGVETVGLAGYSLGSLAAGLAATLWPELEFAALLAPVGHHLEPIQRRGIAAVLWPWMKHVSPAEAALLDRWAPVRRRPLARRPLFLIPLFDMLGPTDLQEAWWETWGRPERRHYRHGHISVCFSSQLYRDLDDFAASVAAGQKG